MTTAMVRVPNSGCTDTMVVASIVLKGLTHEGRAVVTETLASIVKPENIKQQHDNYIEVLVPIELFVEFADEFGGSLRQRWLTVTRSTVPQHTVFVVS